VQLLPNLETEDTVFHACLFDLDGTLVDSLADLAASANRALAGQGLPTHATDEYRRFVGRGVAKLIEDMLPAYAKAPESLERTRSLFEEHYSLHCLDRSRPYEGVEQLLSNLRGYECAVVSNKPDVFVHKIVSALFGNRFEVVMGQREGIPRKPDPAGTIEACSLMGVEPARCLYLGDSGIDMMTARAAGMFPAGALWGFGTRQELVENGAQALCEKPEDLLDLLEAR
jgi:phosphoglycolate phosphatase